MPKVKGEKKAAPESESDDEYEFKPAWQCGEEKKSSARSSRESSSNGRPPKPKLAKAASKGSSRAVKGSSSSRPSTVRNSDDEDDGSRAASPTSSTSGAVDDEKDEDEDDDRDEWRLSNRTVTAKHRQDPAYIAQSERWQQFRQDFPVPLRQPLSAGAILALRKQLKQKRRLVVAGIPIQLRRDVWEILSGARAFAEKLEHNDRYGWYLRHPPSATVTKQISSDVGRALRGHMKFTTKTGQAELTRLLTAFAVRSPSIGYANSMCHIAAFLLLFYPEQRAFWLLCSLVDIILPQDYYTNSLLGARADSQLLKILVFQRMPRLHQHISKHGLDVSIVALRWLMPLFLTTLPLHVCIRLFDILMLDGSTFLLSVALALFQLHSKKLLSITDSAELFEYVAGIGQDEKTLDSDAVIKEALSSRCSVGEDDLRRRDTERRIMETAYLKELQVSLKFKKEEEERRRREEEERRQQEEDEELSLSYGTEMWKLGAKGKPRRTQVYLRNETPHEKDRERRSYAITWDSKSKQPGDARLLLRDCSLHLGLAHGQFMRRPDMRRQWEAEARRCWSVVGAARSLDLVCLTDFDLEQWMSVLRRLPMASKDWPGKRKTVSIGADGRTEGGEEHEEKRPEAATATAAALTAAAAAAAVPSVGSVSRATVTGEKKLSRLQQAREERAMKGGDAPANNRLAALLKAAPPPDLSDDEDVAKPQRKKK